MVIQARIWVKNLNSGSLSDDGRFIKRLRLLMQGQKEKTFSDKVGLHQATFRRYLDGSDPSKKSLIAISRGTGVSIGWLVTGEGPMRPGKEKAPPPDWEQEKAELEEKVRDYRCLQEHLKVGKQKIEAGKQEIEKLRAQSFLGAQRENELLKGQVEAGKREVGLLKEMAALKEIKQLPPPPTAGGGVADMTLLGLAECGLEGWLLKKPLSAKAVCPADMNPAEDFAVIATGQSLFHAGIEPGFTCFCAAKSAPRVGDIVYVLKPSNTASLGLVRELEHKEKGSEVPWLVLQKWHDLDPKTGLREPYTLRENRDKLVEIVPVIYVQRRPI